MDLTTARTRRWRRWRTVVVVAVVVVVVAVGGLVAFSALAQRWGGNVPSGVSCGDLPALAEVKDVLAAQAVLVQRIEAVGPFVDVMAAAPCQGECSDRGEIHVSFASFGERDRVLAVLGRERFGVPVSMFNV